MPLGDPTEGVPLLCRGDIGIDDRAAGGPAGGAASAGAAAAQWDGKTRRVALGRSAGTPCSRTPARDPLESARAYRSDGNGHWARGDAAAAVRRWQRALEATLDAWGRVPDKQVASMEVGVRTNLAQGELRLERFQAARKQAAAVLALEPGHVKAKFRLAEAYGGLGEWAQARQLLAELEADGQAAAAAQGRQSLLRRQRAARREERQLAARMFGGAAEPARDPEPVVARAGSSQASALGTEDGEGRCASLDDMD